MKQHIARGMSAALMVFALAGCGGDDSPTAAAINVAAQTGKVSALRATGNVVSAAPMSATAPIHVALVLKLNDEAALHRFVQDARTPGSASFGAVLTSAQIAARYTPSAGQIATVKAYLQSKGFTNINVAGNNMIVEADAPAGVVSGVFQTTLVPVAMADGTSAHINTAPETLPDALGAVVQSVLGLDTATRLHPHFVRASLSAAAPQANASPTTAAVTVAHSPTDFPGIYSVGSTPTASNITVGIIAEGNVTQPVIDLATFASNHQWPAVPVSVINVGSPSADTSANTEWSLDSQTIVGMSGGVRQLNFYVAPSFAWSNMALAINRAVTDNTARVVNMSIGGCENWAPTAAIDTLFELAVAQGQTFAVSSGDSGSVAYGCNGTSVQYPATSPYVVAVGGTSLYTNGNGSYAGETAWDGSGGGISGIEPIPSWQSNVPALKGRVFRGMPDIAFDADPYSGAQVVVGGQLQIVGGTSLSAPLFAATWARMLSGGCAASLGFAAPTLYSAQATSPSIFRDVTNGSNGAYSAGSGWDFVTGWGTPNVSALHSAICVPTSPIYGGEVTEGTTLRPSQIVYSASGSHRLAMQDDGNLVLYNTANGAAVWNSGTNGNAGAYAVFQTDGNFVIYSVSGKPLWFSSTNDATFGHRLSVQDDGNMVIYRVSVPVFATSTSAAGMPNSSSGPAVWNGGMTLSSGQSLTSGNGANVLVMQGDGNLVLLRQGVPQWSSRTYNHPGAYATMQGDGNLVVYSSAGAPLWYSGTSGNPGAATYLQDDGNIVIYARIPSWSSNTAGS
ncbi:protease pro-enzyme activation domain-containing protein [Burkholderia ambifaria]|uniref:protease pro-enzyme activation domain-containing protein n=1 Tax=Burkholderia ambifaria TaxID=152480 RepID=UPI00158A0395|nr:protease pro-enzyme activation domain-containing protein [Burkholderia ambifaria]WDR89153.1 protease pro-enzyme activation domain-containing protein [Burkholderia ambifaria]WDS01941.1 protease pro-enzyme activation domain-containing protein [Burkholderia ambifaria]